MPRKAAHRQAAPINNSERMLTVEEARALLNVGRAKMSELISTGAIKSIALSPRIRRIRMSALQQYVDSL